VGAHAGLPDVWGHVEGRRLENEPGLSGPGRGASPGSLLLQQQQPRMVHRGHDNLQ
jgi:hypothetical protein